LPAINLFILSIGVTMNHHNPITEILNKLKRHPHNSDQPDLTQTETIANQRQLIKFWVDHSRELELENEQLKLQIATLREEYNSTEIHD
jgi:hypothetical protein